MKKFKFEISEKQLSEISMTIFCVIGVFSIGYYLNKWISTITESLVIHNDAIIDIQNRLEKEGI